MGKENKAYRIRTNVSEDNVVTFSVDNTVDTYNILSLDINQTNAYRLMNSETGIVAGRVLANGGFGVPNVKVSVFIEYENTSDIEKRIKYHYTSTKDFDDGGIRYNLLPQDLEGDCHQNIGTFISKRVLLDNNTWIDVFDKYYSLTTRTNDSGDYLIYGVPVGVQTIHMDVDLSDIGVLSQTPRDMMYKGYNATMFESPTKFKNDTNLDSLAQVISQDKSIYVYPFWGDTTDNDLNASITRCDMNVNYKFEPTCIFMGSVVTDTGENSMSKKCIGAKNQGRMSEMVTGEGRIEMIRKTPNGQIEQFSVMGDKVINSDGVWCYQIPMNLDYVKMDEFGKIVMSDNPSTGLPTRARVRFRVSMAESPSDGTARKRARFLIPNNPRLVEEDYPDFCETKLIDYEFGTKTKDENFRDLMWNNVYTVKSYIPRLQKSKLPNTLKHLGIKMVNHSGANNPMPFNNLRIKFNFTYMFMCTLVKVLVTLVGVLNRLLTFIGLFFHNIGKGFYNVANKLADNAIRIKVIKEASKLFAGYNGTDIKEATKIYSLNWDKYLKAAFNDIKETESDSDGTTSGIASIFVKLFLTIGCGIALNGLCETDDGVEISVTPGTRQKTKYILNKANIVTCNNRVDELYNCIENQLAQDNEVTSFNFYNDWINGVLYFPLWYRRIRVNRKGEIKKDQWCSSDNTTIRTRAFKKNLKLYATNVQKRTVTPPTSNSMGYITPLKNEEGNVVAQADDETGAETIYFKKKDDDNCYGYQCHKFARSYFKIYKGLIVEKLTMLGDKVQYYKPCNYDIAGKTSDLVTLYATDLVLLGSLKSCDIHGIPQFFKCLESTTYNMPPDLMVEDYEYMNEEVSVGADENDANEIDLATRKTEYTGADWGNLGADQSNKRQTYTFAGLTYTSDANENQYDNGGLFYGLTCFNSYTKPKSNINLSRICELGVSLDESQEIPRDNGEGSDTDGDTDTLTPDGFVSYDEIINPDYRSMFATLNSNWLKTRVNKETGLLEYDFNHLYVDNFDGSLKNLMMAQTVNGTTEISDFTQKANYTGNHNLEISSDAYLNFRYGDYIKRNGKKIYYYEGNESVGNATYINPLSPMLVTLIPINGQNRIPRYENSFYFYFGLNEGKTAIDKFNTEFYSDCVKNTTSEVPYDVSYLGNSWCPPDSTDGFIAFNTNIETPITVVFTNKDTLDVYTASNIKKQKFILGTKPSGDTKYANYSHYDLYKISQDAYTQEGELVPIMKNGSYNVEVIDGNENTYEDSIVFELPRIGFVCDVNPFNCKNNELLTRCEMPTLKETYSAIANRGSVVEYFSYLPGAVIPRNARYYVLINGEYVERVTRTTINVEQADVYYYKSTPQLERDICGYMGISDVTESDFRLSVKPVNQSFFGSDYNGFAIDVHVNNGVPTVTEHTIDGTSEIGPGYLGYTSVDDVITYYLGLPYGAQRYHLTLTQICNVDGVWVESQNVTEITVIVYEDDFKMYLNTIDYDIIRNFKTGWSETELVDGEFKKRIHGTLFNSTFTEGNIYGWNDIFNIGKYLYQGVYNNLKPITYNTNINEILAISDIISTSYVGNGDSSNPNSSPYCWSEDYCYNVPTNIINLNYKVGTIMVEGEETPVNVTRHDYVEEYGEYGDNNYLYNESVYYRLINNTYVLYVVEGVGPNGISVLHFKEQHEISADEYLYYKLDTPQYYATYTDSQNNVVANENDSGDIEYASETYYGLNCVKYAEYRVVVDEINEIINKRLDFAMNVAAAFRINDDETSLSITVKTKATPVKYMIIGNGEILSLGESYKLNTLNYIRTTLVKGSNKFSKISIDNTYDTNNTSNNIVSNGSIVDGNFETTKVIFELPTLTNVVSEIDTGEIMRYERHYKDYTDKRDNSKHPYYVSAINDNKAMLPLSNDPTIFDDGSDTQNRLLTPLFGVHFYDKPLKGVFPTILSYMNDIPAYPSYVLGTLTPTGRARRILKEVEPGQKDYIMCEERVSNETTIEFLDRSDPNMPVAATLNTVTNEITYNTNYSQLSERSVEFELAQIGENTYQYNLDFEYVRYTTNDNLIRIMPGNIYYRWVEDTNNSGYYQAIEVDEIITIEQLGILPENITETPVEYNFIELAKSGKNTIINISPDFESDNLFINDDFQVTGKSDVYSRNGIFNGSCVLVGPLAQNNTIQIHGTDKFWWCSMLDTTLRHESVQEIMGDEYTDDYRVAVIQQFIFSKHPEVKRFEWVLIFLFNDNNNHYFPTEVYKKQQGYNMFKKVFKYSKDGSNPLIYRGTVIPKSDGNWQPLNVSMPGFVNGYMYNGNKYNDTNDNIKLTINENEVSLYTLNDDIYENTTTKRLIYTDYSATSHPPYGVYKIDTSVNKNFQYTEIPLSRCELVYTDGYGDAYRKEIDGTFNMFFTEPILIYQNSNMNRNSETHDDYFSFATTNVEMQAVYYIFDCDKTEYPLKYYVEYTDDVSSDTMNTDRKPILPSTSNLQYDETTNEFYFKKMPKVLSDLDNSNYISKSKKSRFNMSEYLYNKYRNDDNFELLVSRLRDKFFMVAVCDGYCTLSPVIETQPFKIVRGYFYHKEYTDDNRVLTVGTKYCILTNGEYVEYEVTGSPQTVAEIKADKEVNKIYEADLSQFKNIDGDYVYLTVRDSRDRTSVEAAKSGIHYIEDCYYMSYYRFKIHFKSYNPEADSFTESVYTQICSIADGTAEKCYIKVEDKHDTLVDGTWVPNTYWATALRFEVSGLGAEIPDWYTMFVEDTTGIVRHAVGQWAVPHGPNGPDGNPTYGEDDKMLLTVFENAEDMLDDYNRAANNA